MYDNVGVCEDCRQKETKPSGKRIFGISADSAKARSSNPLRWARTVNELQTSAIIRLRRKSMLDYRDWCLSVNPLQALPPMHATKTERHASRLPRAHNENNLPTNLPLHCMAPEIGSTNANLVPRNASAMELRG